MYDEEELRQLFELLVRHSMSINSEAAGLRYWRDACTQDEYRHLVTVQGSIVAKCRNEWSAKLLVEALAMMFERMGWHRDDEPGFPVVSVWADSAMEPDNA